MQAVFAQLVEEKMTGWKRVKLGDVCETNKRTYSNSENWNFVNYLDTGNLTENQVDEYQYIEIGKDKLPSRARRKVKYNDILYSTVRPNQLHYGIVKNVLPNLLVSTGFTVISVNPKRADSDFIYYYLTQNYITETLHAIGEQSTSAYPSIKPSDIEGLELKLPPLDEQEKISRILCSLDDKIENNRKINHHLEQMISTIFENTFVDKCNTIKLQLQNVADISNGFSFKSTNLIDSPTGECRAVFKMGNIIAGGGISHSSTKSWVSHKNYPDNKFLSCTGDILMSMTDMKNNVRLLGHTALIDKNSEYYVNQRVGIIRSKNKNEWMYLYPLTNSQGFINILRSRANSGVQVNLTTTTIKEMEFQFPKEDAMRNYISSVSPLFFNKFLLEQEIISLKSLRDTLLPKLLSGEISVSQATK